MKKEIESIERKPRKVKKNKQKFEINRNKYNDIKRMDHREMNEYINGVRQTEYERGFKEGLEEGEKRAQSRITTSAEMNFDNLEKNLQQISGVGKVRAGNIIEIVRKELEKNEETTKTKENRE